MIPASLLVSDDVQSKEVTFPNGEVHTLWFLDLTQEDFRKWRDALDSKDEADRKKATATLLSVCVCEPDGERSLTVEQALKIKPAALLAISNAVMELNGFSAKNALPPGGKSGSGTPSPSPLAAEP